MVTGDKWYWCLRMQTDRLRSNLQHSHVILHVYAVYVCRRTQSNNYMTLAACLCMYAWNIFTQANTGASCTYVQHNQIVSHKTESFIIITVHSTHLHCHYHIIRITYSTVHMWICQLNCFKLNIISNFIRLHELELSQWCDILFKRDYLFMSIIIKYSHYYKACVPSCIIKISASTMCMLTQVNKWGRYIATAAVKWEIVKQRENDVTF